MDEEIRNGGMMGNDEVCIGCEKRVNCIRMAELLGGYSNEKPEEEYKVVVPFSLKDIWAITDDEVFEDVLDNLELKEWNQTRISDCFYVFNSKEVPPSIWNIRDLIEDEGYIIKLRSLDGQVVLTPGMMLIYKDTDEGGNYIINEEFIVCRTGNDTFNLFSVGDWNRWADEGFDEGTTLEELEKMADTYGCFFLTED